MSLGDGFGFARGRIVEVTWLDSAGGHGWQSRKDEVDNKPYLKAMHCRSVGYVVDEDDTVLVMTSGISGSDFVQCTNVIPKFAIVSTTVLADGYTA